MTHSFRKKEWDWLPVSHSTYVPCVSHFEVFLSNVKACPPALLKCATFVADNVCIRNSISSVQFNEATMRDKPRGSGVKKVIHTGVPGGNALTLTLY